MLTDALDGGVRPAGSVVTALQAIGTRVIGSAAARRPASSRLAALCAGAALITVGLGFGQKAANAQAVPDQVQRDFDVKAGVFIPSQSVVRSASATLIPEVEGDYTIQRFPESNFISQLGVAYIEHGPFRMVPFTVSQIYRDSNNSSGFNYYYGLGLGLYSTRLELADTDNRTKLLFGGLIVTGIDFTKTIFGELKYNYVSKYDNKEVGGFQISAGVRF